MAGQKTSQRQKDISRLLREKKNVQPWKYKKATDLPLKKKER
jgi:hypothetical protein